MMRKNLLDVVLMVSLLLIFVVAVAFSSPTAAILLSIIIAFFVAAFLIDFVLSVMFSGFRTIGRIADNLETLDKKS
jgi:hypothetical protein